MSILPGRLLRDQGPEAVLANLPATLYRTLRGNVAKMLEERFEGAGQRQLEQLKIFALRRWRRTLKFIGDDALATHVRSHVIAKIDCAEPAELTHMQCLLLFAWDRHEGTIRFWCPVDDEVLASLEFPYTVPAVLQGIGATKGLPDWEFPILDQPKRRLRRGLAAAPDKTQYIADLTSAELRNEIVYPDRDWLAGIKSVVYLSLPSQEDPHRGITLCIASPIPNLFGARDIYDARDSFFHPFLQLVVQKKVPLELTLNEAAQWVTAALLRADYQRVESWVQFTAGLSHGIRKEGDTYLGHCADLLKVAACLKAHGYLSEAGKLTDIERYLHVTTDERRMFAEFLAQVGQFHRVRQLPAAGSAPDGSEPRPIDAARVGRIRLGTRAVVATQFHELYERVKLEIGVHFPRRRMPRLEIAVKHWRPLTLVGRGAIMFIWHQMLHNAVMYRGGGGAIRLLAALETSASVDTLSFRFTNSVEMSRARGSRAACAGRRCPSGMTAPLWQSNFYSEEGRPYCSSCLRQRLEQWLRDECFRPVKGHGSGLGLFVIKFFVEQFFRGQLIGEVSRWDRQRRELCLGFSIPAGPYWKVES